MIRFIFVSTVLFIACFVYQVLPLFKSETLIAYDRLDSIFVDSSTSFIGSKISNSKDSVYWVLDSSKVEKINNVTGLTGSIYISPLKVQDGWKFTNPFDQTLISDLKVIGGAESYYKLSFEDNAFSFVSPPEKYNLWGKQYSSSAASISLLESFKKPSAVAFSDDVYGFDQHFQLYDFKPAEVYNREIAGYKAVSPALVEDSFEKGKWDEFKDCKDRGAGDITSLRMDGERQGLVEMKGKLSRWACMGKGYENRMQKNKLYRVGFDYKVEEGQGVSYFYNIGDGRIGEKFDGKQYFNSVRGNSTDGWSSHSLIIKPDADATEFDFFFYLDDKSSRESKVLIDNFKLEELAIDEKQYLSRNNNQTKDRNTINSIEVGVGSTEVTYDQINKIIGNSDFESGPWSNVKDCASKNSGTKLIRNNNNSYTEVAPDGEGRTCTSESFPITMEKSKIYKLKFKYKNIRGKKLQFYYNLINKNQELNKQYFVNETVPEGQWASYEKIIDVPASGTEAIDIFFYASEVQNDNNVNYIDDIELVEYSSKNIQYQYLYSTVSGENDIKKQLKINDVKYSELPDTIVVLGSRPYDSRGELMLNGNKVSSFAKSKHIKLNNHLNGWIVDLKSICNNDQNCDSASVNLTYTSFGTRQKLGLFVTTFIYLVMIAYCFLKIKNRKK